MKHGNQARHPHPESSGSASCGWTAPAVLAAAILSLAAAVPAGAQTELPGGVLEGATLRASESPFLFRGDLEVRDLSIEPGVQLLAGGDFAILVTGRLEAVGTESDSILISAPDTIPGWQGLVFESGSSGCRLSYCTISRSLNSGIRINNTAPVIDHCRITGNRAVLGAGIKVSGAVPLRLADCEIVENSYDGNDPAGGGIHSTARLTLLRTLIQGNRIAETQSNCFNGKNATAMGGGIFTIAPLFLEECLVLDNIASARGGGETTMGGGIFAADSLVMSNCAVVGNRANAGGCNIDNRARGYGGGIYAGEEIFLANCILAGNGTRTFGGGLYAETDALGSLVNCTILENAASTPRSGSVGGIQADGAGLTLTNSIAFSNAAGSSPSQVSASLAVTFCDVEGGRAGEGNIDLNPLLSINPDIPWDIVPAPDSPCIDAGDPSAEFDDLCFPPSSGTPRNDMGAQGGPGACRLNFQWTHDLYAYQDPVPHGRYFLLALPMAFPRSTTLSTALARLGPSGSYTWRGFGITPEGSVENPTLTPGAAYWVATASPVSRLQVSGVERTSALSIALDAPGFHGIGIADFDSAFAWPDVQVLCRGEAASFGSDSCLAPGVFWYDDPSPDLINNGLWRFERADGSFSDANPWQGYLVYAYEPCEIVLPAPKLLAGRRSSAEEPTGWEIRLTASAGPYTDPNATVGVRSDAMAGHDRRDLPKPALGAEGIQLGILQAGGPCPLYMAAFDRPGLDEHCWDLLVRGDRPLGTIGWEGVESVPGGFQVYLEDESAGNIIDLRSERSYDLVLEGERRFRIRVTRETLDSQPARTEWLSLSPNPTTGAVTVSFSLSQAAPVSVRVFDVSGRLVSTLFDGCMDRGTRTLHWTAPGNGLSGGVYFLRLQAGSSEFTRRIAVVR